MTDSTPPMDSSSVAEHLRRARAVFFDAGFTLLEPIDPIPVAYRREAIALGIELPSPAFEDHLSVAWETMMHDGRGGLESSDDLERAAWHRFTANVARPFPELARDHEAWLARLFDHFDSPTAWRPLDGAIDVLTELKTRGTIVGVVSNWHSVLHPILAGHDDLFRRLDFILTSAETGRKKPHSHMFETALARAGVRAHEAAHVGDSQRDDIDGANAVGITAIQLVPHGFPSSSDANDAFRIRHLRQLVT